MKRFRTFLNSYLVLLLCAGSAAITTADEKEAAPARQIRVLFVGNSQSRFNDLPRIVEALSEAAPKDWPRIKTGRVLSDGTTLENQWNFGITNGTARAKITEEKWDYVILQEWFWKSDPETFAKYAGLFHELIRQNGAQTVLFATANFPFASTNSTNSTYQYPQGHLSMQEWITDFRTTKTMPSAYPQGFQYLNDLNVALGKELKVPVAAGGQAWTLYWGDAPTLEQRLDLFHTDKGHPGPKGSYLYACTLFSVLTGHSPVGIRIRIPGQPPELISPAEDKRMQEAAWQAHREVNGK